MMHHRRRTAKYQVRQYQPFWVAQTQLDNLGPSSSSSSSSGGGGSNGSSKEQQQQQQRPQGGINPASAGMQAFNALAQYIFGGNAAGAQMAMTTPVFSSTAGTMAFVVQPPDGGAEVRGCGWHCEGAHVPARAAARCRTDSVASPTAASAGRRAGRRRRRAAAAGAAGRARAAAEAAGRRVRRRDVQRRRDAAALC
jgi:hypothetical protein